MGERALAVGLGTLAQFLGFVLAMVLGPALVVGNPALASYGSGVELLLKVHCGFTLASAAFCIMFLADRGTAGEAAALAPPTPIRVLFRSPDFRLMLGIFAAGLGILNALSGMEDAVAAHVGAVTSDGMLGASLIGGGIVGAIALPALSDFLHKRRPFLILCMCGMIPGVAGVAGMAWAGKVGADPGTAYLLAKVASGVLGFFLLGGGSIGFQYAAEVTHPAPEATSQGLLLLAGQVTGIIFMVAMGRPALLGPVLVGFTTLAALCGASSYFLKESPLVGQRP
jgi:Na+/melibiose symporter-like transporter